MGLTIILSSKLRNIGVKVKWLVKSPQLFPPLLVSLKRSLCGVLEKYTHGRAEMNNKKEAKKSGDTSRKSPKTGLKQRSYSDKFKLKVMREMVCTGETLAALSKRHDVPITTISRWISTFGITTPKQIREQVMSKNISDIERRLIEKERECEELKVRLREAQIGYEIKKASLDYLCSKYHIDLKKKIDLD